MIATVEVACYGGKCLSLSAGLAEALGWLALALVFWVVCRA